MKIAIVLAEPQPVQVQVGAGRLGTVTSERHNQRWIVEVWDAQLGPGAPASRVTVRTPAAGFTREFKDHRRYTAGDDFRAIDWRLFARLEKPFIRIFEEVQRRPLYFVQDRLDGRTHEVRRVDADQLAGGHLAGE